MLIVPYHGGVFREHLPLWTLLILAINVVIFFGWQLGDSIGTWTKAGEYYDTSGLADLERPRYRSFLLETGQEEALQALEDSRRDPIYQLLAIENDQAFQSRIRLGLVFMPGDPETRRWQSLREELHRIIDESFDQRYAMSYTYPQWHQWLTHMFLHGGFGDLLGNMIFLVLIGMLVEPAMRGWTYLACYLIGGFAGAAASLLVHLGEPSGMLGASGAIAGLMGLFTTTFGRRKVRFFYWAFVYFDYVRAPALLLLPAWLGWELVQFLFVDSNVAYEAHAAGLAAGALLGVALHHFGLTNLDFLESNEARDPEPVAGPELEPAREALRKLELEQADRLIRQQLLGYPDAAEAWELQYRISRFSPNGDRFHVAARWLLLENPNGSSEAVRATWEDYRVATGGKVRLAPAQLVRVGARIVEVDERGAAQMFQLVRKRAPETVGLRELAERLRAARQRAGGGASS